MKYNLQSFPACWLAIQGRSCLPCNASGPYRLYQSASAHPPMYCLVLACLLFLRGLSCHLQIKPHVGHFLFFYQSREANPSCLYFSCFLTGFHKGQTNNLSMLQHGWLPHVTLLLAPAFSLLLPHALPPKEHCECSLPL